MGAKREEEEEGSQKKRKKSKKTKGGEVKEMASFGIFLYLAILCLFTVSKVHAKHFLVETEGEVGDRGVGDESSGLNRLAQSATGLDEKGNKWISLCRCEDGCEIITGPDGCECRNTEANHDCDFLPL